MEVLLFCSLEQMNAVLLTILCAAIVTTAAIFACSKSWKKANMMPRRLPLESPITEESRDAGLLVLVAGSKFFNHRLHFPATQSDEATFKPTEQVSTDKGILVIS